MRSVEAAGKSRHEAIQNALEELGAELHEVQIQILEEGSRGLFGLGAKDWRVRLSIEGDGRGRRPRREREQYDEDEEWENRGNREEFNNSSRTIDLRSQRGQSRGQRGTRHDRGSRQGGGRQDRGRGPRQDRSPRQDRGGGGRQEQGQRQERGPRREREDRPERSRQQDRGPRSERERERRQPRPVEREQEPREPRAPRPPREFAPITEERCEEATALLHEILEKMGFEATCASSTLEDNRVRINIESADSALLIGRKGRNLQALQYLINRMMRASDSETIERFVVDVESYLDRRKESLEEMARHFAEKAKESARDVRLKPLNPQERRIIHLALQDDPEVRTFSLGSSTLRTVVISPKNASRDSGRGRRGDRGYGRRDRVQDECQFAVTNVQANEEPESDTAGADESGTEES